MVSQMLGDSTYRFRLCRLNVRGEASVTEAGSIASERTLRYAALRPAVRNAAIAFGSVAQVTRS